MAAHKPFYQELRFRDPIPQKLPCFHSPWSSFVPPLYNLSMCHRHLQCNNEVKNLLLPHLICVCLHLKSENGQVHKLLKNSLVCGTSGGPMQLLAVCWVCGLMQKQTKRKSMPLWYAYFRTSWLPQKQILWVIFVVSRNEHCQLRKLAWLSILSLWHMSLNRVHVYYLGR